MTLNPLFSVDDFYYFYLVVKYGGFSAASEATMINKSKLSRHIVNLENKFNVSLIQRTTRCFKVTPLGLELYSECCKMMMQVQGAESILTKKLLEPEGTLRISCPPLIANSPIRHLINHFLKAYPKVNISIHLSNQTSNLDHENLDIIIRNNCESIFKEPFIVRDLVYTPHILVAHPSLQNLDQIQKPNDLAHCPCIHFGTQKMQFSWHLKHRYSNESSSVIVHPRLITSDLSTVYYAVHDNLGITEIPLALVQNDIKQGLLVHVLPDWQPSESTLQIAYSDKHNQRLLVEKLVDFLIEGYNQRFSSELDYTI